MSGAAAIQSVVVSGHEERTEPSPHTVFRLEIRAHVRSWTMWRRYSEFAELYTELTKSTGSPPPAPLPPKNTLSKAFTFGRARTDLEERRQGLEAFLRAIVGAKDSRWRDSYAFREFLGVPVGRAAEAGGAGNGGQLSAAAWLDEQLDVAAAIRDMRADLNRRDALSDSGDVGGAHSANVQAKKKLAAVLTRVGNLASALDGLARSGMAQGELQRRADIVGRLQDDCEKIGRIVSAARHSSRALSPPNTDSSAPASDREALLGGGRGAGGKVTRVFGQKPAPVETAATRPLDDTGLLQLQQQQMDQQDSQLAGLTAILQRQRQLGVAIHNEISQQNELLDDLNNDVDRVGGKLSSAKKMLNKF
ncbi:hypothetical protein PENSPDRAFT_664471 [Peniophora sp. CONT]|nr:hypothetical protein PENSPDRAFT_664471 [Peniophora sp. CONT]